MSARRRPSLDRIRRLDRRHVLALGLSGLVTGCMVGGLRPPIPHRFAAVETTGDALVADLDREERDHLLSTLRVSAADEFRNVLRPGDPSLPRLEVSLVSLTLASGAAPSTTFGTIRPAHDQIVAEWSIVPARGGRGPRFTTYADRPAHRPGEAVTDTRRDRLDLLCGRLWGALWDELRRT